MFPENRGTRQSSDISFILHSENSNTEPLESAAENPAEVIMYHRVTYDSAFNSIDLELLNKS